MSSTIQQRILEVLLKDMYGTYSAMADEFDVTKQNVNSWIKAQGLPMRYASYLSRKFGIPYFLLNYHDYVLVLGLDAKEYLAAIKQHTSPLSQKYILEACLPDNKKIFKENDKKWTR